MTEYIVYPDKFSFVWLMKFLMIELCKLVQFAIIWAVPMVAYKITGSINCLWLLLVSLLATVALFDHYQKLYDLVVRSEQFSKLMKDPDFRRDYIDKMLTSKIIEDGKENKKE